MIGWSLRVFLTFRFCFSFQGMCLCPTCDKGKYIHIYIYIFFFFFFFFFFCLIILVYFLIFFCVRDVHGAGNGSPPISFLISAKFFIYFCRDRSRSFLLPVICRIGFQ